MVIDVFGAKKRIEKIVKKTPLAYSDYFTKLTGNKVFLKLEDLQITGSFKIRGAYNKISKLTKKEKRMGIIAASSGNHAQGVALSARLQKVRATIVMPENTPLAKIIATRELGAKVVLHGKIYDEAYQEALRLKEKSRLTLIHPYNDESIISGQGTIGLEILDDLPGVQYVFVPVGGGGLISGIALAIKTINKKVKIIGVQAEGANPIKKTKKGFEIKRIKEINTIADGIAVKQPGDLTLEMMNEYVDKIVTVNDEEISEAVLTLLEKEKYLAEPAGAVALAAVIHKKVRTMDKKVAAVISGGNIDIKILDSILKKGMIKQGRLLELNLTLANKPGEFKKLLEFLSKDRANVIHVERTTKARIGQIGVGLILETEGKKHILNLKKKLEKEGFKVGN